MRLRIYLLYPNILEEVALIWVIIGSCSSAVHRERRTKNQGAESNIGEGHINNDIIDFGVITCKCVRLHHLYWERPSDFFSFD